MAIPMRHIWKTINSIPGQRTELRKYNLHIGRTIRDLEMHTEGKPNKGLQDLLQKLEQAEREKRN